MLKQGILVPQHSSWGPFLHLPLMLDSQLAQPSHPSLQTQDAQLATEYPPTPLSSSSPCGQQGSVTLPLL